MPRGHIGAAAQKRGDYGTWKSPEPQGRPSVRTYLAKMVAGADPHVFEDELARRRLMRFTVATFPTYEAAWFHHRLCGIMDRFVSGELKRIMVFMPPRHGKSELVSRRLPAYLLGKNPDASVIACSYGADLASRMNRDVQRIMDTEVYRRIFPGSRLSDGVRFGPGKAQRNSDAFEIVNRRGLYRSAGVGGGITGLGANFAIIDDPVKNWEEASSAAVREGVWEWYTSTLYTRLEPGAGLLLTMTRWHHDDLAGRILRMMKAGDEQPWSVFVLPAFSEEEPYEYDERTEPGLPLWEQRFDAATLRGIRQTLGEFQFDALYQQRPGKPTGTLFKLAKLRRYRMLASVGTDPVPVVELVQPEGSAKRFLLSKLSKFATVDLAASLKVHADYFVMDIWGVTPDRELVLLDKVRDRIEGPDQLPLIQRKTAQWKLSVVGIETGQYQLTMVQQARRAGLPVRELEADRDKVSRAIVASAMLEGGQIYVPESAAWLSDFERELVEFPAGAHDDQVDTLAYAARLVTEQMVSSGSVVAAFGADGLAKTSYWRG